MQITTKRQGYNLLIKTLVWTSGAHHLFFPGYNAGPITSPSNHVEKQFHCALWTLHTDLPLRVWKGKPEISARDRIKITYIAAMITVYILRNLAIHALHFYVSPVCKIYIFLQRQLFPANCNLSYPPPLHIIIFFFTKASGKLYNQCKRNCMSQRFVDWDKSIKQWVSVPPYWLLLQENKKNKTNWNGLCNWEIEVSIQQWRGNRVISRPKWKRNYAH